MKSAARILFFTLIFALLCSGIGLLPLPIQAAGPNRNPEWSDLDFSYIMLHMNGTDGSTTFTDDGKEMSCTWTKNNQAQIDTGQYKWGGASGLFDGAGDWIYSSNCPNSPVNYSYTDWTIDFQVRFNGDPGTGTQGFYSRVNGNNNYVALNLISNQLVFIVRDAGSTIVDIENSWDPAGNTWYHVAITETFLHDFKMYIDGVQIGTTQNDASLHTLDENLKVGSGYYSSSARELNGWIDEFRESANVQWTSNFTPPDREYDDIDRTATAAAAATSNAATQTASAATATAAAAQTATASELTATAAANQTAAASELTATAAYYQTATAAELTATAAYYQTETALPLTQTEAANLTATAAALTAISAYLTSLPPNTPTNTATNTPTDTATVDLTALAAFGTPAFDNTITYGNLGRFNALACILVILGLWSSVWLMQSFFMRRRR
jgi:hypothetical protein